MEVIKLTDIIQQITQIKCKLQDHQSLSQICIDQSCQNKTFDTFCVNCEFDNQQYHSNQPHKFLTIPRFFKVIIDETLVKQQEIEINQSNQQKDSSLKDLKDAIIILDQFIQNLIEIRNDINQKMEIRQLQQQSQSQQPLSQQLIQLIKDIANQTKDISELKKLLIINNDKILMKQNSQEIIQNQEPIQEEYMKWISNLKLILKEYKNLKDIKFVEQKSKEIQDMEKLKLQQQQQIQNQNLNNDIESNQTELNEYLPIVIDNGSGFCKVGFGEEGKQIYQFPTIIGRPRMQGQIGIEQSQYYIGDEAHTNQRILQIKYPIERGIIKDWDDMEKIWRHCFKDTLKISSENHPFLMTEIPRNPKQNREKMTQIMFEEFDVSSFYLSQPAVLSLYASGRTTGIVIDVGDNITHVIPIYEGYSLPHAIDKINFGGRDLTNYLAKILEESGYQNNINYQGLIKAREIKEKYCYVALDYDQEYSNYQNSQNDYKDHELPDGQHISIQSQRIRCPELLFNPEKVGFEFDHPGLHQLIFQSIQKCNEDTRKDLFQSIILAGGSTMFPGIKERLNLELLKLVKPNTKVKIIDNMDRINSACIGGQILSSLSTFSSCWITKSEYEDDGPNIIHRKCVQQI